MLNNSNDIEAVQHDINFLVENCVANRVWNVLRIKKIDFYHTQFNH